MPEVTIVIPNYNEKTLLENCIRSLEQQSYSDFKVLIVDNGSTDGSAQVTSDSLNLTIIALETNTGFCKAVNLGAAHTTTPYLILLNNDTEVDSRFVEEMLAAISKSNQIFSVGAQMLEYYHRDVIDNAGDWYTALGWAVARGKGRPEKQYETEKKVFSCCGGACIYRTSLFLTLGALDEQHFAYLEDVDLGYRAQIHGYENWYAPAAKVYHIGSATTGNRYNEIKVELAARNTIYVIYKNMPLLQIVLNFPLLFLGILIKWIFFSSKGLGKQYLSGVKEGIQKAHVCKRVPYKKENLKNYLEIQLRLWVNIFRIIFHL